MKITATRSIDINGFSFATYLPGVSMQRLIAQFPAGHCEGYVDDEKGYDGDEVQFVTDDGECFYVYSRWNELRIGCLGGWHNERAEQFKAAVLGALGVC